MALKPELFRRLARFAVVGAIVMLFFTGLNWLFGRWMGATAAFLLAYPPAVTLHFLLSKWWTFGCERADVSRQVSEYLAMVALTFVVQYAFFWLAHSVFGLPGWLSAGIANAAQMALTFLIMQRRIFARRAEAERVQSAATARSAWLPAVVAVLVISAGLRVVLALNGGQLFWGDEQIRYGSAQTAYALFAEGQWTGGWREILANADHPLFRVWSLPAAAWQHHAGVSHAMAATYFAAFSVLALSLIWGIARRAGADEREAFWALLLAAGTNALFFYSRHLLPYDMALCAMLAALWFALGGGACRLLGSGVLVGLGFLTYSGYWLLGGTVLVLAVLFRVADVRQAVMRAAAGASGLAGVLLAWLAIGWLADFGLWGKLGEFSGTITQGDFGLGWRVVAEYFWRSEGVMLAVWFGGGVLALREVRRRAEARVVFWLAGLGIVLLGLVGLSDVVPKFVVYGRLARCAAPFLCLAAAYGLARASVRAQWLAALAVIVTAGVNFAEPLRQVFPDGFRLLSWQVLQQHRHEGTRVYRILRAEHAWGPTWRESLPEHEVLLRRAHPLQFLPYQFEGYSREQRSAFRDADISMRFVRLNFADDRAALGTESSLWGKFSGPVRLSFRLPAGRIGLTEPLVSSGEPGRADFLFIKYVDQERIQIGFDHWGVASLLSAPLRVDPREVQSLVVSWGACYPPPAESSPAAERLAAPLRRRLVVLLNGQAVFSVPSEFYPAPAGTIQFGANLLGGTSCGADFLGGEFRVAREPLDALLPLVPELVHEAGWRGQEWGGALGPLELMLDVARIEPGAGEPLVSLETERGHMLLQLERLGAERFRVGFERLGGDLAWSDPIALVPGEWQRIGVSLGGLMPEPGSPFYDEFPMLGRLRELVHVRVNGTPLMTAIYPDPGRTQAVALAVNSVGSSVARLRLAANIAHVRPLDPVRMMAQSVVLSGAAGRDDPEWGGWPGGIRLRVRFPTGRAKQAEPLFVRGAAGAGDILFVHYVDEGMIQIGLDHWGSGGPVSATVPVDLKEPHELVVLADFLLPPRDSAIFSQQPALVSLQRVLRVALDGQIVLTGEVDAHPAPLETLTLGTNFIGGSTAGPVFTGRILEIGPVQVEEMLRLKAAER